MENRSFYIGQIVYHRDVYAHKEPLKVVGIREYELELEGDYSGGTHNLIQKQWLPIKGVSTVFNYKYKDECRKEASAIEILAIPAAGSKDPTFVAMMDLANRIMHLTAEVELNPEFS